MLTIVQDSGRDWRWYVGYGRVVNYAEIAPRITYVQADGHELEYIKENFTQLPMAPKLRIVRWSGDMARFIVGNLA